MNDKIDIFDKLTHLPILNFLKPFYKKHKEALLYLFFGGLAFLLNFCLYAVFTEVLRFNVLAANVFCWITCVLFQFFTNRTWVFDKRTNNVREFNRQIMQFFGGRMFTLALEELIIAVFITWLGFNNMIVKLMAQVVVIVLNYVISKMFVFKR